MKFYVRKSAGSEIEGPITVQEINRLVGEGRLTAESLATSDLGEGLERIGRSRKSDWVTINHIPGVTGYVAEPDAPAGAFSPGGVVLAVLLVLGLVLLFLWLGKTLSEIR